MKKFFRRAAAVLTALSIMAAVVFDVPGSIVAEAEETHTNHKVCGDLNCSDSNHENITWTAWTSDNSLPSSSGNYYLTKDVTPTSLPSFAAYSDITLCLNGHTVNAPQFGTKQILKIVYTFTLCDCKGGGTLTGSSASSGAVNVASGNFTMYGGTISGNMATSNSSGGGAVYVNDGTFTMNGGTISGNTASANGGGVYVLRGKFIMNGGTISNNTAGNEGGGVYVEASNRSYFTMNGGTISGNTAANNGGGVAYNGNKTNDTFTINGKVDISGNTKTDDGSASNVFLCLDKTITIGNGFDTTSKIGVNTSATPTCLAPVAVTGKASDISASFKPDIDGQSIVYQGGKVQLKVAHTATETAAKPATCTENGNKQYWYCSGCDKYFSDVDCKTETTLDAVTINASHSFSTSWTTDDDKHWHSCQKCTEITDEADHTGGTATCAEKAVCAICEEEYGELSGHDFTHAPEVPATETTDGTKEYWHCEGCNKNFLDAEGETEATAENLTIPSIGHTHTLTRVPEVPATETTDGTKEHWHCGGCNKDFLDAEGKTEAAAENLTIPSIGHTHTLTHIPEAPATETIEGTKEYWHCEGCGKNFADKNGETEIIESELKIGRIEKVIQSGENAPTATLATSKEELFTAVLTDDDKAAIEAGKDIKIVLQIEIQPQPAPEDKAAVEEALGDLTKYNLGQYLDVNLFKVINGERNAITETKATLTITFEIPAALRGSRRTYSLIRVHDGTTTVLNDTDSDPNTITIETDKFSTYALVYSEKAASASDGSSSGSDGGNAYHGSSDSSDNKTISQDNTNSSANSGNNPHTGSELSLAPLASAIAVVVMATAVKRRKK